MSRLQKALSIASIASLILFFVMTFGVHMPNVGGAFFSCFWFLVAILARTNAVARLFCFPLVVFGCATSSFYFPFLYLKWFSYKTTDLVPPILQFIMFAMGTQLRRSDFAQLGRQPWAVLVAIVAQFTVMPFVGYFIAKASGLPAEVAAGIILVGCVPSGIASNVMSYLGKLNVALSVTLTACTTVIGPFVTPFLLKALAGATVEMDIWKISLNMIEIVVIPIIIGVLFRVCLPKIYARLENRLPFLAMLGILLTILFIIAAGRDALMTVGFILICACIVHNFTGYFLGYWLGRLCRLDKRTCRTVAIEVGMQNAGLASGLAAALGSAAGMGLAPAIFSPVMNSSGAMLAVWWGRRPVKKEENKTDDKEADKTKENA